MAEKSIAKSALEFLNNVFLERDPRNSILDPLTCIIRLGILGFKECGTKVSVADNSIKFNNPNIFQGAKRWSMGDNREDLHNIYNPIKKVTSWFNLNAPEINGIIRFAIRGIHLLKSSYNQNSIICHTLNLYIQELEIALEKAKMNNSRQTDANENKSHKTRSKKGQYNNDTENEQEVETRQPTAVQTQPVSFFLEVEQEIKNKHIYEFFRTLWNENEITICYNLLVEMSKCDNQCDELENYIRSIDAILSMKELKTKDLLTQTSTILE